MCTLSSVVSAQQLAVVTSENANLRGIPSAKGKVVEKIRRGRNVIVLGDQESWVLVQSENYAGWMHRTVLRLIESADGQTSTEPKETPLPSVNSYPLLRGDEFQTQLKPPLPSIRIGMTCEQVLACNCGKPMSINRTTRASWVSEQ